MSSFTSTLKVEVMDDGEFWRVLEEFDYRIGSDISNQIIHIREGELTDFASIPKWLRPFLPSWAKYNKSAPLHDQMYRYQQVMGEPISRKFADDTWLEAMLINFRNHKSGEFVAWLEYTVIRLVGWKAWNNYSRIIK